MSELQRLVDAGLKVRTNPPDNLETMIQMYRNGQYPEPFIPYYDVQKPEQHQTYNVPSAYRHDSENPLDAMTCELYRNIETEEWAIRAWECIPGPCDDDFVCYVPSFADAVTAVYGFYFGTPSTIDRWIIPLHRHPELNPARVRAMIAQAQPVSPSAFEMIQQQRAKQVEQPDGPGSWGDVLPGRFLTFAHAVDTTITLRLRRDLQECFIVRQQPAT